VLTEEAVFAHGFSFIRIKRRVLTPDLIVAKEAGASLYQKTIAEGLPQPVQCPGDFRGLLKALKARSIQAIANRI